MSADKVMNKILQQLLHQLFKYLSQLQDHLKGFFTSKANYVFLKNFRHQSLSNTAYTNFKYSNFNHRNKKKTFFVKSTMKSLPCFSLNTDHNDTLNYRASYLLGKCWKKYFFFRMRKHYEEIF